MKIGDIERPCHNCKKRHVESGYNCHSDCPEYKTFEEANRERLNKVRLKRDEESMMYKERVIARTAKEKKR